MRLLLAALALYLYDCTGVTWDEAPYRKNPFVTGAN